MYIPISDLSVSAAAANDTNDPTAVPFPAWWQAWPYTPFQIWLEGEGAKCGKCVRTGTRAKACCPLMHTEAYPSLYIGKCVWVHWYSAINLLGSE